MPLYSLVCELCGHAEEKLGGYSLAAAPCACGAAMRRAPVNSVAIIGERSDRIRYHTNEVLEAQAEVDYHYEKAENDGMPVRRTNVVKAAKQEARRRGAKVRIS